MHITHHKKTYLLSIGLLIAFIAIFYVGFVSGKAHTAEASRMQALSLATDGSADASIPSNFINAEVGKPDDVDFSLFWKAWNIVNDKFVQTHMSSSTATTTADINREKVYGAIQGMVDSLGDPYTTFFPPAQATQFESQIDGNFEGVGMEMGIKDNSLTVITPLKGSPAEKAGLKTGDKVTQIDGKSTTGMSIDEAVKEIRGKKGTTVTLQVSRDGSSSPLEFKVVRDVIDLPTLDTNMDQKTGIFTIHLYNFSAQSASLFRSALRDFVNSQSNKLVLDLRGNPGGFLDAAVDMASWFLPPGKPVVEEDYGKGADQTVERSKGYNIFNSSLKMVILVDGGSASAAEILSGALSDYGKATLVGTKTFGKGSVQEYMKLDDQTSIKVTVARWLTPKGISISGNGITPDVIVNITPDDVKAGKDPQMEKAVEILEQK
jgi:carboxyl-terminal processing protease